jgi:hypothetical protein
MDAGATVTSATADVALLLYAAALALRLRARGRRSWLASARLAWTAGLAVFIAHVMAAFAFVHHFSHAAAYTHTAERTAEVVGWQWGGGLYFNYLFLVVWLADALGWWRGLEAYERRPRAVIWFVQGFLAFMAFNATVVFGPIAVQMIGAAVTVMLVALRVLP